MKIIPEACRVHSIIYLRYYYSFVMVYVGIITKVVHFVDICGIVDHYYLNKR
jgi:hypothetical protein